MKIPTYIILHLLAGAGIYLACYLLDVLNIYTFKNPLLMVLLVGIAKEIHDLFYVEHTASIMDIVYTTLGGLLVKPLLYFKKG